jgi:Protein of unknown function (DUF998)
MSYAANLMTRPIVGRLGLNGILALAGIAGPLVLVIMDSVAALATPGYSLIRDSISSLAWTKLGFVQTIGFLVIGLLVELFVAGLLFSIRGAKGFGFGIALIAVFGFGLLLVGAFHTDPAGGMHTLEGTIHGIVAKTIFWLFPAAALLIAPSLRKNPFWKSLFIYSIIASIVAVGLMISTLWMPEENSKFGLFERGLVADEILWVEIMAIWLFRLSLRRKKGGPSKEFPA